MYDLIIIGGGPAGITAGIYAARKKINTLFLTKDFLSQITKTSEIDNWPGSPNMKGSDLALSFEKHLRKFDIEIKSEEVEKIEKKDGFLVNGKYSSKALIIATGSHPRRLNVKGESDFISKGVSFCPLCDAPFFKDKTVCVVGAGNAGYETVIDLKKYAKEVFLIEKSDKIIADKVLIDKEIKTYLNTEIVEIKGKDMVQEIVFSNGKSMPVDGVFIQIGSIPNSKVVKDFVELNERGEIKTNRETLETSEKGVFACGDVRDGGYKQVVLATGEGCLALLSAFNYLIHGN